MTNSTRIALSLFIFFINTSCKDLDTIEKHSASFINNISDYTTEDHENKIVRGPYNMSKIASVQRILEEIEIFGKNHKFELREPIEAGWFSFRDTSYANEASQNAKKVGFGKIKHGGVYDLYVDGKLSKEYVIAFKNPSKTNVFKDISQVFSPSWEVYVLEVQYVDITGLGKMKNFPHRLSIIRGQVVSEEGIPPVKILVEDPKGFVDNSMKIVLPLRNQAKESKANIGYQIRVIGDGVFDLDKLNTVIGDVESIYESIEIALRDLNSLIGGIKISKYDEKRMTDLVSEVSSLRESLERTFSEIPTYESLYNRIENWKSILVTCRKICESVYMDYFRDGDSLAYCGNIYEQLDVMEPSEKSLLRPLTTIKRIASDSISICEDINKDAEAIMKIISQLNKPMLECAENRSCSCTSKIIKLFKDMPFHNLLNCVDEFISSMHMRLEVFANFAEQNHTARNAYSSLNSRFELKVKFIVSCARKLQLALTTQIRDYLNSVNQSVPVKNIRPELEKIISDLDSKSYLQTKRPLDPFMGFKEHEEQIIKMLDIIEMPQLVTAQPKEENTICEVAWTSGEKTAVDGNPTGGFNVSDDDATIRGSGEDTPGLKEFTNP